MSSRDELIKQMLRGHTSGFDMLSRYQQQIIEQQQKMLSGINKYALELANTMSGARLTFIEQFSKQIRPFEFQAINAFKIPSMTEQMAEAVRRSIMLPIPNMQSYAVQAVADLAKSISKVQKDIAWSKLSPMSNIDFTRMGGISSSAALAAFQLQQDRGLEQLHSTFAGLMSNAIKQALEALDERDERVFARVEELVNNKIATLPHNQVTAEGFWQMFLTILAILISLGSLTTDIYQAIETRESSKTQPVQFILIKNLLQQIASNTQQLVPEQDQNIYYVVERQIDLKLKPQFKSVTITTIFPNQKVRLVQMNHQWIYVEYFDYLEGVPKYGWANKKYLKRLDYQH